jgi:hypothetical protein
MKQQQMACCFPDHFHDAAIAVLLVLPLILQASATPGCALPTWRCSM